MLIVRSLLPQDLIGWCRFLEVTCACAAVRPEAGYLAQETVLEGREAMDPSWIFRDNVLKAQEQTSVM